MKLIIRPSSLGHLPCKLPVAVCNQSCVWPVPLLPLVDPNLGGRRVGRLAAGPPRGGGGSVGTPTYIPQNDPHDALIILNMHKWGKKFSKKNCPSTQAPISQGPTRRPGPVQNPFLCFSAIFEFSTNSDYFEYRHIGSKKNFPVPYA